MVYALLFLSISIIGIIWYNSSSTEPETKTQIDTPETTKDDLENKTEQENKDWESAKKKNTKISYTNYITNYPKGKYLKEAKRAIDKIEQEEKEAKRQRQEEAAERERKQKTEQERIKIAKNYPKMVRVAGGTFTMGDEFGAGKSDEQPTHEVTLSSYYIGKTEVTVAQYRFYCKATGTSMPNAPSWGWNDNDPITTVSWNDAIKYCKWLSKKLGKTITLPTEAQWEFAAREGNQSRGYKYSGSNAISAVAWYSKNSNSKTHRVAQKKANELGLYDMSGNVWEWCLDWYDKNYYSNSPNKNPKNTATGTHRVLRGGSWFRDASRCRVAFRFYGSPDCGINYGGFRVVSF